MTGTRLTTLALALVFLGACTLVPEYTRPDSPLPASWPEGPHYDAPEVASSDRTPGEIGWREFFVDDNLKRLIELALQNNRDARIAALRVEQVRARYQLSQAEGLPEINAQASYTRRKTPSNFSSRDTGSTGGAEDTTGAVTDTDGGNEFDFYNASVGLTAYELDLFGRVRSLEAQALQEYLASRQAMRSAQISLIAEVANAYLRLLANNASLELSSEILAAFKKTLELVKKRADAGIASQLEVEQASTAVQTALAEGWVFYRQVGQSRNALIDLIGTDLPEGLIEQASLTTPKFGAPVNPGMQSDLLLRRPDILEAEHNLLAANANIGAARAAFFPSVTLAGSYGTLSTSSGGLFEPGSTFWSFSPRISLPIFDGGRNNARLDEAEVTKKIEVAQYQRTIQTAFREVTDALAVRASADDELAARFALKNSAQKTFELASKRYRAGVENFLAVLDAQRNLLDAGINLAQTRRTVLSNTVELYKVLGGGWREHNAAQSGETPQELDKPGVASGLSFWSRLSRPDSLE